MKNVPLLIGTLVGTVALIAFIALTFSSPSTKPQPVDSATVLGKTHNVKGPENAKVTLVEFSDFQCPACKAIEPTVQQILKDHPSDVRLVYRYFPLVQIHKNAQQAALTAEAVAQMGKFWEIHDLLFDKQDEWADLSDKDVKAKFDEYLSKLQIDKKEFKKRIDSQEVQTQITEDVADGTKLNIDGTPTFYVNGQKTSAPELITTVESALKSSRQ